jgi:small conductance mechanosensitive channel
MPQLLAGSVEAADSVSRVGDRFGLDIGGFGLLPLAVTLAVVAVLLVGTRRLLDRGQRGQSFASQATMGGLVFAAVLAVVLALPVDAKLKESLLGVIGIVLSAVIALSSTSIMGNALAGLMLRSLKKFRLGDYIRCGEHFGRVTERGLIHTEIQTEDSDLVTLPNLFLVAHPLTTVRARATVISATVSLGYDVPRETVERLLLDAAVRAGLDKPFVRITGLGDFSIGYRIAGVLMPVEELDWSRSKLRGAMLDVLHGAGIEIVSPAYMNQRQVVGPVRPPVTAVVTPPSEVVEGRSDEIVFAEAEEARDVESAREELARVESQIADLEKQAAAPGEDVDARQRGLDTLQRRRELLVQRLAQAKAQAAT